MADQTLEEGGYKPQGRVYIHELADIVDRRPHTIRQWQRSQDGRPAILPQRLFPKRDSRGWRYWTPAQVQGVIAWMEKEKIQPGKGINRSPDPEKVREMLRKLRAPRRRREET